MKKMRRFRTRPSCARSVIYVEDADGDSHNSLLFQTLIQPSRKEERFESAQEIDHSCTVLSRTFGSRGQKKRNPPRLKPIEDVDEEELLEAQKKEMIRMHEDAANFSLIIEMNGQRVRQIDAYHFEPYDEEKVRQEKENKYQEELQLVESKLKDLRKRKTTYSPPKKMSPTILSSRQNTLRPFSNSTTLRTPSAEKTIFDLQQEAFQRDELHFTALELSHNEELEFTALEAPQTDEFQMECSNDKLQVTALEPTLHDGLQFTALETPQSNKSNTLCKTTQLEELQFTALEITQHDELQYTNLEIPESDELEFAPLEILQTEELQFTPLECPENDKLQTTALELTQCEKLQLTALESPQRNELQVTAVPQSDTLQFTVFETTQKDQLQFTTLDPFSECSLPTALNSMLASTRYLEGTMNGTGMTKRRNITQIVPYDGSEGEGKANTKAFYLYDYDGNLEDHLGQVLHVVRQETPIPWSKLGFKKIRKLGEGSYGEVFSTQYKGQNTAVKIVPFNTDAYRYNELVNGENMLEPGELLPEILISQELSALYNPTADNSTPNFIRVLGAHVMKGELPSNILNAWKKYDKERTSENDNPAEYSSPQQLYLALCLAMGGEDLEKFQFETEEQIFSVLIQVAMSLVIAEEMLEFEHRDLHHGNLLLEKYDDDIEYRYQGQNLKVKSHGIRVNIIDFSLSRMSKEKTTLFKDLSNDDELFTMEGQYQYDIYRRMKETTTNDWKQFTPKTNVYWLHYLANQMIIEKKCKKTIKKKRKDELMELFERVLDLDRLRDMFTDKPLEELLAPYVESFEDENVY